MASSCPRVMARRRTASTPMVSTPPEAIAPIASSGIFGAPSFRTSQTSSGAWRTLAISNPTGTPPRGRARTWTSVRSANEVNCSARSLPASVRSRKRMEHLRALPLSVLPAVDVRGSGSADVAPALDLPLFAGNTGDGFGVADVLFNQDAFGQGVTVVGVENRDDPLQHDNAVVEVLIDKMDRAAGELDAVFEGLLLRFEAGKGGQQRRMDIEDAVGKGS